jgi:predicted dehydrogenase
MSTMHSQPNRSRLTRRNFLQKSTLATATAAAFTIVPGHVLGLRGATPPSSKLNIAGIGVAAQGHHDLRQFKDENIVALCDVDWRHAAGTFREFPQARQYKDYRKMLDEQKDIDAVVVATPDHVHALASMNAIQLGKHVYCEKPLTHSVWESRRLAQAARDKKVATQMGNQGAGSEETRRLQELVWNGAIGRIHEVHLWTDRPSRGLFDEYWPQGVSRPRETQTVPDHLDWDLWLGPAKERPYHSIYAPFRWRGWWDFGTGALGDIGCHSFDPVFRALKLGHPISVEAASSRVNEDTYPLASMVTYHFPARTAAPQSSNPQIRGQTGVNAGGMDMPPLKLVWYDGGLRPARPEGLEEGDHMGDNGRLLIGEKGFLLGNRIFPNSRRAEFQAPAPALDRSIGHYAEWVQAAKGGLPAGANFDWAGPLTEVVLLGNIALRVQLRDKLTRTKLMWDPAKFEITSLPEANEFLRCHYRQGWSLG